MPLVNCKECGRLFNRITRDICPTCMKQDDENFLQVSRFLREHRGASPEEVHAATDVELETIFRYIREGRLIAANFPNMSYPCERCGIPIQLGRFCKPCTDEMKSSFQRALQQESAATNDKAQPKAGNDFHIKDRFGRN